MNLSSAVVVILSIWAIEVVFFLISYRLHSAPEE